MTRWLVFVAAVVALLLWLGQAPFDRRPSGCDRGNTGVSGECRR